MSSQYPIPCKDKINFATTWEACCVQYDSVYSLHNVDPECQAMSSCLEWLLWCFCKVPTVAVPCVILGKWGPSQIEILSKWWESGCWRAKYECKQESDQKSHLIPWASFSPVLRTLAAFPEQGRSHQPTYQETTETSVWHFLCRETDLCKLLSCTLDSPFNWKLVKCSSLRQRQFTNVINGTSCADSNSCPQDR